ncbi:MAG: IS481 family transposase [Chloroflexota bacterium]
MSYGTNTHGSATTTEAVRRAIQNSQESIRALAKRYSINPKTVVKWKKRDHTQDCSMGPKQKHSTTLTQSEEAMIVAFRRQTLLSLDDCLYALRESIPHLTRSTLHRCLQRHGISRLSDTRDKPRRRKFKSYPIGYFHIDIAEVRTDEGKLHLFVAVDRTSKSTFAELHDKANRPTAVTFLQHLIATVPYKIHTILTDNGIQFTNRKKDKYAFQLLFDRICNQHDIEHRLTRPNHPWTNGQVERMNRTLKEATVYRYFYDTHQQLRSHLETFLAAYNFAKRLKTLKGVTPYEFILHKWQDEPERFHQNPYHLTLGLYTWLTTRKHMVSRGCCPL